MSDVSRQLPLPRRSAEADIQSAAIKAEANKAFAAKDYPLAIKLYSDGIAIDPSNHVLYSNRAAAKSGSRDYQGALEDAEKVCAQCMW
jgi:stress-induced-phosphoprotein 1